MLARKVEKIENSVNTCVFFARVELFDVWYQRLVLVFLDNRAFRHLVARRAERGAPEVLKPAFTRHDVGLWNAAQDSLQCCLCMRSPFSCLESFVWRLLNLLERAGRTHSSADFGENAEKFKVQLCRKLRKTIRFTSARAAGQDFYGG